MVPLAAGTVLIAWPHLHLGHWLSRPLRPPGPLRFSQCPRCRCGQAISTVPATSGTTCESLEPSDSRRRVRFVPYAETIQ